MAALLVVLGMMAVALTVALPSWRQMVQREKEDELIFRGLQYVRAISLYQRKFGPTFPPNVDILVEQNCLRRKYGDPVNKMEDFEILFQGSLATTMPGQGGRDSSRPGLGGMSSGGLSTPSGSGRNMPGGGAAGGAGAAGASGRGSSGSGLRLGPGSASGLGGQRGGVVGVVSKSTEKSLRTYAGRNYYNEWQFVFLATGQGGISGPGMLGGIPGQPRGPGALPIGVGRGGREGGGRMGMPADGRGSGRAIGPGIMAPGGGQRGPGFAPTTTQPQPTGGRRGN